MGCTAIAVQAHTHTHTSSPWMGLPTPSVGRSVVIATSSCPSNMRAAGGSVHVQPKFVLSVAVCRTACRRNYHLLRGNIVYRLYWTYCCDGLLVYDDGKSRNKWRWRFLASCASSHLQKTSALSETSPAQMEICDSNVCRIRRWMSDTHRPIYRLECGRQSGHSSEAGSGGFYGTENSHHYAERRRTWKTAHVVNGVKY
jgi:hypothetical protein